MIVFRNGEFEGGDLLNIIQFDLDDNINADSWWDHCLLYDVVILSIPRGKQPAKLMQVSEIDLDFVPLKSEEMNECHAMFWNSSETFVFENLTEAIRYMKLYSGENDEKVSRVLGMLEEDMVRNEAMNKFHCTCDLDENADADFLNDLTEFVQEHPAYMSQVLASMKLYMLEFYKSQLENTRI